MARFMLLVSRLNINPRFSHSFARGAGEGRGYQAREAQRAEAYFE